MDFTIIDEEPKEEPIKIDDIILSDGQKIKVKNVAGNYIDFHREEGYTGDCRLYLAVSSREEAKKEATTEFEKYITLKGMKK